MQYPSIKTALLCVMAFFLSGCQPGTSGDGSGAPPVIQSYQTTVFSYTSHSQTESDMIVRAQFYVTDEDGLDNLSKATITEPDGTTHTPDDGITLTTITYTGYTVVFTQFAPRVASSDGTRQIEMTGYSIEITDKQGNSDSRTFDLYGYQGEEVPMGTLLVHPEDYSVNGSGGDYRSSMKVPTILSATQSSNSLDVEVSIDDSRTEELRFNVADQDGNWVGHALLDDTSVIENAGQKTYSVSDSEFTFYDDQLGISDIKKVSVMAMDTGRTESGPFNGYSQLISLTSLFNL